MIGICGDGAGSLSTVDSEEPDKRKAVETLLADAEWVLMSDREAARVCGVTHPFVASVRSSLVTVTSEGDKQRTYTTKHDTTATMDTGRIGKREVEFNSTPPPQGLHSKCDPWPPLSTVDSEPDSPSINAHLDLKSEWEGRPPGVAESRAPNDGISDGMR